MRPGVGALAGLLALVGVVVYVLVDGCDDCERAEGPGRRFYLAAVGTQVRTS